MSKKMMKRSLALGVLMAFVITGSAMAASIDKTIDGGNFNDEQFTGVYENVTLNNTNGGIFNNTNTDITIQASGSIKFSANLNHAIYSSNLDLAAPVIEIKTQGLSDGLYLYGSNKRADIHDFESLTIETTTKDNAVAPVMVQDGATVNITSNNENSKVTVSCARGYGLYFHNSGSIDVKANTLTVTADYSGAIPIYLYKGGSLKIEAQNLYLQNKSVDKMYPELYATGGNIDIDISGKAVADCMWINGESAAFNFDINGKDASFTGQLITTKGANTNISVNGGTWNLTEASSVLNATFTEGSVLNLVDGDKFTGTDYALTGNGKLVVANGAKLQIGGIKETTYNIATGFTSYDVAETLDIADNALLQANKKLEGNNYQVIVAAKDASQMASDTGISESTAGLVAGIIEGNKGEDNTPAQQAAVDFITNANNNNTTPEAVGAAINNATKMAEAGGNSATAANIVKNVTGVTNDRLSFNCGHSAPHKGGHGVGLFEEGSGADIWVEYVHGKDKVEDMPSDAGATSYEGQYNGFVMGVDFKRVNKFQSGVAFNYGEGDTNSIGGVARTHSDYDFWGVGYYGSIHNDDSNVIFDINYAKTDSDVTQENSGSTFEASSDTTTWSAGVKLEKLYQNENVQIVPYTGLRYMSIDSDDYSTKCGAFNYSMERQDIWLLPLGVSIKQEVTNDNGWTVSPRVDLSYIWAFGDTNSNMEVKSPFAGVSQLGYDVMDDGSFLGLVGIEAHKGQWGFGVSYSYQKGDHSESKKWYVDANYSF